MALGIFIAPDYAHISPGSGIPLIDVNRGDYVQIARIADENTPNGEGLSFWWVRGTAALLTLHETLRDLAGWSGELGALVQADQNDDTVFYPSAIQDGFGYTDQQMLDKANALVALQVFRGKPMTPYVTKPDEDQLLNDLLASEGKTLDWLNRGRL